jgi:hypothetical protein
MPKKIWLIDVAARSPHKIKYHMSQTKGIRTELSKGKLIVCEACKFKDAFQPPTTLYRMDKTDNTCVYLCATHYVQIAKAVGKEKSSDH